MRCLIVNKVNIGTLDKRERKDNIKGHFDTRFTYIRGKRRNNDSVKVTLTSDPLDEEAVKKLDGY